MASSLDPKTQNMTFSIVAVASVISRNRLTSIIARDAHSFMGRPRAPVPIAGRAIDFAFKLLAVNRISRYNFPKVLEVSKLKSCGGMAWMTVYTVNNCAMQKKEYGFPTMSCRQKMSWGDSDIALEHVSL